MSTGLPCNTSTINPDYLVSAFILQTHKSEDYFLDNVVAGWQSDWLPIKHWIQPFATSSPWKVLVSFTQFFQSILFVILWIQMWQNLWLDPLFDVNLFCRRGRVFFGGTITKWFFGGTITKWRKLKNDSPTR